MSKVQGTVCGVWRLQKRYSEREAASDGFSHWTSGIWLFRIEASNDPAIDVAEHIGVEAVGGGVVVHFHG